MKTPSIRFSPRSFFSIFGSCVLTAALGLLSPVRAGVSDLLRPAFSVKTVTLAGTSSNTINSLVFNDNGTISIESEQDGHLSNFGHFTGHFSYLAIPSPVSILLFGSAVITNDDGDSLFLSAIVTELGTDYPYTVTGTLTVTGGTGRFAGATGVIAVSGKDTAELTDRLKFHGQLLLVR